MIAGHCGSITCPEDCRYCKYGIGAVDDEEFYSSYLDMLEAEWEKELDEKLRQKIEMSKN